MVKTRSNSSNSTANGDKNITSIENLDNSKSSSNSQQQLKGTNKNNQEAFGQQTKTTKNAKTSIILDDRNRSQNKISNNGSETTPCSTEHHRNRVCHKRVSKPLNLENKQLPSSTITSTDLKAAFSSQQDYCSGNIAEVVRRQVSPSVSITPTISAAAGPSNYKRQYHHRIPDHLISATDVIDKHHQRQQKLKRRKSFELFHGLDETDIILNTANMTEEQILEEMRRRNKEDAAKCRELMRKIQSRSQAVTMTAAERLSKSGLLGGKRGKVSKFHMNNGRTNPQLFRKRSSIEAPQDYIEATQKKDAHFRYEQPGCSSGDSELKFHRASALTHQKYQTALTKGIMGETYHAELSPNQEIEKSNSILATPLSSSLSNHQQQIVDDTTTDKAGSSYSGWCRKRNRTTGEMQLVRKHSDTISRISGPSKRQRLDKNGCTFDEHPSQPSPSILSGNHALIHVGSNASTIEDSDIEDDPEDLAEMERRMQEEGYLSSDDELTQLSRPNNLLASDNSDIENCASENESTSTDRSTSSHEGKHKRRRRRKTGGDETPPRHKGDRVAYIHVGEGGEADLEAQLKGADNLDIQILEEENLPDIDETDMIHGLDHTGTSRDYVDETHRCTEACPVGCQGHLRPNEIVIYESFKFRGKLCGRRR